MNTDSKAHQTTMQGESTLVPKQSEAGLATIEEMAARCPAELFGEGYGELRLDGHAALEGEP
jgi:hypothetical protein